MLHNAQISRGDYCDAIRHIRKMNMRFSEIFWSLLSTKTNIISFYIFSFCVLRRWAYSRLAVATRASLWAPGVGGTSSSDASRCPPGKLKSHQVNFSSINFPIFFLISFTIISDQSVPHHHRQIFERCRREFQHTFEIHRSHRCGN